MSSGNRKLYILIASCAVMAVVLAVGIAGNGKGTTKKTVQSSLLNTKYIERVTGIVLSVPDDLQTGGRKQVVLSKEKRSGRSVWLADGSAFSATVIADSGKINGFLELLSSTSSFTVATESYKDWNSFGVTDDTGVQVSVKGIDDNGNEMVFSSLYFGYVTATETHIAVRSDRKETVYQVRDVFSGYFDADPSFWAVTDLFPELPELADGAVSQIRITGGEGYSKVWYAGEEKFDRLFNMYGSVSGGQLVVSLPSDAVSVLSISLLGEGRMTWQVNLFKTNEGQYIAECLSPWDAKIVTVSSWTADRLLD